jgi:ribosomal protein L7/L12
MPSQGQDRARRSREALLEEQVSLLAAGYGIQAQDPVQVIPPGVLRLAREGETIQAIRALRKLGMGMVSAKRVVDAASGDRPAPIC